MAAGSITLILSLLSVVEHAAAVLPRIIAAAKQSGELTDEQEKEFTDRLASAKASDHMKTDDELSAAVVDRVDAIPTEQPFVS